MIEIRLFGETRVVDGTRTVGPREFGGIKPRQVLEVLALNAGHHVTKDRLVDCLWGEHPPASAIPTLEAYVSLLRRRLDPAAPVATSALRTTNGGYALDTARVRVDHLDFQRLLSGSLLEPAPVARQRLQQGLDLAHADLLESEPYVAWAIRARADVHADIVSACEAAGLRALAGGDWADAAALVRRAILLDPLAETCARILIEALWRDGRRNEALRAYGELRRALADDLGSDPDARTHALYLQVLRGTAAAPTAAAEHGHDVRISRGISSDEDLLDRLVGILLQSFGGPGGDRQGSNDTLIARLAAELLVA